MPQLWFCLFFLLPIQSELLLHLVSFHTFHSPSNLDGHIGFILNKPAILIHEDLFFLWHNNITTNPTKFVSPTSIKLDRQRCAELIKAILFVFVVKLFKLFLCNDFVFQQFFNNLLHKFIGIFSLSVFVHFTFSFTHKPHWKVSLSSYVLLPFRKAVPNFEAAYLSLALSRAWRMAPVAAEILYQPCD